MYRTPVAPPMRKSAAVRLIGLALVTLSALAPVFVAATPAHAATFPDPAMQTVWARTDKAVQDHVTARTWMWGPDTFYSGYEPYLEGPGGQHLVAYLDKSRMEINDPAADRNQSWFVTNGLLVVEMMTGRIQTGNATFQQVSPASIPVAGDVASSLNAPTYASLAAHASLNGDNRAPDRTGQPITEGLQRTGDINTLANLAQYSRYGAYEPTLGHNIPDVFWSFMNQKGPVYENGQYVQGTVVDWLFAMGYPITEPYWIPIQVGSEQRWVLVQAFQRRILTYSPNNPQGFQVEMGNVGRAYYDWRYNGHPAPPPPPPPVPTPTTQPAPPPAGNPTITINPTQGDSRTTITVNGANFPANSPVDIRVERADANYYVGLATVTTGRDGKFTKAVTLPAEAGMYNKITIAALANHGSLRAAADFTINFNPSVDISPKAYVINAGGMSVSGSGFPSNSGIQIGLAFDGQPNPQYVGSTRTDNNGNFQVNINIGRRSVGALFSVFAIADNGVRASYRDKVAVINQPVLQASPASGPVSTNVTVRGSGWPAGEQVTIGYRGAGDNSQAFLPNLLVVDRAGNFSTVIFIDANYAGKQQVIFQATEGKSGIHAEATYTISSPPPPRKPAISVNPVQIRPGQSSTVSGTQWTPGAQVSITLNGAGKQETVATATADRSGNFTAAFTLGAVWSNAGQVQVTAYSNDGFSATTGLIALPASGGGGGGGGLENGLDMSVRTYVGGGQSYVKLSGRNWRPGLTLTISVISSGGDVNFGVATATVLPDGTWQASFNNTGPWLGRTDLGVRASDQTGTNFSGRRLPVTTLTKVSGAAYTAAGANWTPGTEIDAILQVGGSDFRGLGSAQVDANGNFAVSVSVPRADGERQIVLRSHTGIAYEGVIALDGTEGLIQPVTPGVAKVVPPAPGMPRTGAGPSTAQDQPWLTATLAAIASSTLLLGIMLRRNARRLN